MSCISRCKPCRDSLFGWALWAALAGGCATRGAGREQPAAPLVIEAFACALPPAFVEAMARCDVPPRWLNLEYLSAEDWVEGCDDLERSLRLARARA